LEEEIYHVLGHAVSVVVRRSKRILRHHPTGRENDEIYGCYARLQRGAGENGEYGGVEVVEGHGVHHAEVGKVVLIRRVVAVPSHNVEWAMPLLTKPQRAAELMDDDVGRVDLFERSVRHQEVACGGKAVCSYGSEVRQLEVARECFANVTCEVHVKLRREEGHTLTRVLREREGGKRRVAVRHL
jgi:hypothetical protein